MRRRRMMRSSLPLPMTCARVHARGVDPIHSAHSASAPAPPARPIYEIADVRLVLVIRENQILNEELQRSGQLGERFQLDLQKSGARVVYLEQLSKADESEKEELLSAYRRLGDEAAAL
jgi:hypothetical protein